MSYQTFETPIEIWVKEDLLLPEVRPMPLLMHTTSPDTKPELNFWNLLRDKLRDTIVIRSFQNLADAGKLVAIPYDLQDYRLRGRLNEVYTFNRKVIESGRISLISTGAMEYMPKHGEIVFATSTYKSSSKTAIPLPAWLGDLATKTTPIQKPKIPTIGFVGETYYSSKINNSVFKSWLIPNFILYIMACSPLINRYSRYGLRTPIAKQIRERVISELQKKSYLKTSFIKRKGGFFNKKKPDWERKKQREEYLQNLQNNAYHLCIRGTENYSYRLYEVMSAGRIPIIIDTNMALPNLDGFGRWEEFSIIVPISDLHQIEDYIRDFHNNLSDEVFRQVCIKSRAAFEYLLPHNFFFQDKLLSKLFDIAQKH